MKQIRFACDRMAQLEAVTKCVKELGRRGIKPYRIFVYCLIRDVNESLERINALRKLKVCPFAQPYRDFDNNIEPTNEQKRLARWCNHKAIFKSVEFKITKDERQSYCPGNYRTGTVRHLRTPEDLQIRQLLSSHLRTMRQRRRQDIRSKRG